MNPGWTYHTAERMKMHTWTRKRRLKFRKRWRKQHGGQKFRWFIAEPNYAFKPLPEGTNMIVFQREHRLDLGMSLKP